MGDSDTATSFDISSYGKLSIAKGKLERGAMTHMRTNAVAIGTLK
jgi:hypothetical protein